MRKKLEQIRLAIFKMILAKRHLLYVNGSEALPPPLSKSEENLLIKRLAGGESEVKSSLIERNIRLVVYIARKFDNTGVGLEDLISIGTIGLIKAVNTFDHTKGIRLSSYAARCIENEVLMYFRAAKKSAQDISMNEPIDTDKDGNALTLMDVMSTEDNIVYNLDCKVKSEQLKRYIAQVLTPRERLIIELRYGLNNDHPLTQREVAARLKISRSYVSRIEKKALQLLKRQFDKPKR